MHDFPTLRIAENSLLNAAGEDPELLKRLIEKGADIHQRTSMGKHNILRNLKAVQALIDAGADVNALGTTDNFSALMLACRGGHQDVVDYLLKSGTADLTHRTKREKLVSGGYTCLHLAVISNNVEILKLLLQHGADGAAVTNDGYTALHVAAERSSIAMLEAVIELIPALHKTCERDGNDSCMHKKTADGRTALFIAVDKNDSKKVRALLETQPSDANLSDKDGFTPLHKAVADGHNELLPLLLRFTENVNAVNNHGYTPLLDAASSRMLTWNGTSHVVKLLLENGANSRVANHAGETSLMIAVHRYNEQMVSLLIEDMRISRASFQEGYTDCKADWINRVDKNGHSALYHAEQYGRKPYVAMLHAAGANDSLLCQTQSHRADTTSTPVASANDINVGNNSAHNGSVSATESTHESPRRPFRLEPHNISWNDTPIQLPAQLNTMPLYADTILENCVHDPNFKNSDAIFTLQAEYEAKLKQQAEQCELLVSDLQQRLLDSKNKCAVDGLHSPQVTRDGWMSQGTMVFLQMLVALALLVFARRVLQ